MIGEQHMQTHTQSKTFRMSNSIASAMENVCSKFQIKESEYMRRAVTERLESDLKPSQKQDNNFTFI